MDAWRRRQPCSGRRYRLRPNIIDIILDGDGQTSMLSSYDVAGHTYAQLTGFEMPEVPQQIFGASVDTVTSSSAVLTWSTTVANSTSVQYVLDRGSIERIFRALVDRAQVRTMPSRSQDWR